MPAVVDTNVVLAALDKLDIYHKKALEIWKSLRVVIIPTVVFHELAFHIVRKKLERGFKLIKMLIMTENVLPVKIEPEDILFACEHAKSFDDYNDFIILNVAKRLKASLATFDEELRKLAKRFKVNTIP